MVFFCAGMLEEAFRRVVQNGFYRKKEWKKDSIFVCGHTVRSGLSCPFGRMQ